MNDGFLEDVLAQTDALRTAAAQAAGALRDFSRRLELILSQDYKNIAVRDTAFVADFSAFCADLRQDINNRMDYWQQARAQLRAGTDQEGYALALSVKSFVSRAKTLSRASDDLSTAYAQFGRFYKNYTLAKLPVWLLTSCCDDINNLTGKILFLSRELAKKTEKKRGSTDYGR